MNYRNTVTVDIGVMFEGNLGTWRDNKIMETLNNQGTTSEHNWHMIKYINLTGTGMVDVSHE